MNCIECPWFESCDEINESYCINDELNRVKTELEEMEENNMEKELVWTNENAIYQGVPLPKCNQCKYYEGVHNIQGHAPCSYHNSGGVLWDWYCSQFEADKEEE